MSGCRSGCISSRKKTPSKMKKFSQTFREGYNVMFFHYANFSLVWVIEACITSP